MPRSKFSTTSTVKKSKMRACTTCGELKQLSEFYARKSGSEGKASRCKSCTKEYNRNRYANSPGIREQHLLKYKILTETCPKHRAKSKERGSKFYNSISGRAKTLRNNAKKARISKILPCTVDLAYIEVCIASGFCPVTGIRFELGNDPRYVKNPFSPSLDRIDSSQGYTNKNTRIVIWQYNLMKGEMSDHDVRLLCEKVLKKCLV